MERKRFITIAGNIGAGKTTLAQLLENRFLWKAHFEPIENNPYLVDFYSDMARWSFPIQIFYLNHRFRAHRGIQEQIATGMLSGPWRGAVQDRSIYEDSNIFARNLFESGQMDARDFENYMGLYESMCEHLTPPDLMIYLRKDLPALKKQIALRARGFEKAIPDEYLSNLNRAYDSWMHHYALGPKLVIDSNDFDFLNDVSMQNELLERIEAKLAEIDRGRA